MKRKTLLFLSSSLVFTSAFFVASCSSDDDFLMGNGLDINSQVPLTRSGDGGTGASQEVNEDPSAKYKVPVEDDECGLWAITQMAVDNKIEINTGKTDKKGKPIKRKVGHAYGSDQKTYTATDAYNDLKNSARSKDRFNYDNRGNRQSGTHRYTDGEITPTDLADVAFDAGIMTGGKEYFESYEEMVQFLDSDDWKSKHKKGTYVLYNPRETKDQGHFSICNGTKYNKKTNQMEVNCKDWAGKKTYTSSDDNYPEGMNENRKGWAILY